MEEKSKCSLIAEALSKMSDDSSVVSDVEAESVEASHEKTSGQEGGQASSKNPDECVESCIVIDDDETQTKTSDSQSIFSIRSANQTINDALKRPDPLPLYGSLWFEGELSCLFADSNVGKSILAVQMADKIASERPSEAVIYFDFELSDKMFQLRYTDDETGEIHHFPENLIRIEIDSNCLLCGNFEDQVIKGIEDVVISTKTKVIIIDNLTWLCSNAEKGDMAGVLMMRLKMMRDKYDLSVLVLSHTPKRDLSRPITQNDLNGSKKLFNFFRSVFAIGKSAKDGNLRYIKQLKVTTILRRLEYCINGDVNVYCIRKVNGMVIFDYIGQDSEKDHLRHRNVIDEETIIKAKKMKLEGLSYAKIAEKLNIEKTKLNKTLKPILDNEKGKTNES